MTPPAAPFPSIACAASALDTLDGMADDFMARLPYTLVGLVVFVALVLVGRLVKFAIHAAGQRTRLDPVLADLLGSLAMAALVTLGFFAAAVVIFPAFKPGDLITGLGITSIAVGFAFKDILQNLLAGIFILWRRPFHVGDQIRTRDHEGTVETINVRATVLRTYDGEKVVVPNGDVYTGVILVRTAYGRRRVKFSVGVGYPDSIEEARAAIHRVLADTEGVLGDPGPWVYVTELAASSVNFTVYFWTEAQQANVLRVSDRVATGIKLALDRAGIDMPYPHTVVLLQDASGAGTAGRPDAEGKSGPGGAAGVR